jgi:hypothetical protein
LTLDPILFIALDALDARHHQEGTKFSTRLLLPNHEAATVKAYCTYEVVITSPIWLTWVFHATFCLLFYVLRTVPKDAALGFQGWA